MGTGAGKRSLEQGVLTQSGTGHARAGVNCPQIPSRSLRNLQKLRRLDKVKSICVDHFN